MCFLLDFGVLIHFLSISFGVKVLNLVEQDLLAIPSIAELHEVWDFLSINSQVAFFFYGRLLRELGSSVEIAWYARPHLAVI
jgi:hypothetical protein